MLSQENWFLVSVLVSGFIAVVSLLVVFHVVRETIVGGGSDEEEAPEESLRDAVPPDGEAGLRVPG